MKKHLSNRQRLILGLAANLILFLPVVIGYRGGAGMIWTVFPILHFALSILHFFCADSLPRLALLCGAHLLCAVGGIALAGRMFFDNAARDAEGEAILLLELIVGAAIVLMLSLIVLLVKRITLKSAEEPEICKNIPSGD